MLWCCARKCASFKHGFSLCAMMERERERRYDAVVLSLLIFFVSVVFVALLSRFRVKKS